ncbi:MAG: alkaline phosphatase family protein [Bdellovibrionia bacterium]
MKNSYWIFSHGREKKSDALKEQLALGLLTLSLTAAFGCVSPLESRPVLGEDPVTLSPQELQKFVMPASAAWKTIQKVVVIVLENKDLDQSLRQPDLSAFSKKGAMLSQYFAITHPSQPNYIALISGSTQNVKTNFSQSLPMRHLGDLLEEAHKTWKAYAEDYPGDCFLGGSHQNYVRKHVPFLSFENVQKNPNRCKNVVNFDEWKTDLLQHTLPDFSLVIPNQLNNGHDTSVDYAGHWVSSYLLPLIEPMEANPDTLFVLTFDEGSQKNQVYTVLYGASVKPGWVSQEPYSHFGLLRTVETILGLSNLGLNDSRAKPIVDVWKE